MVVEALGKVVVVIVQRIVINATVNHVTIQTNDLGSLTGSRNNGNAV